MEVLEAIRARRSVRSYTPEPVPDEVLLRLLEAARLAPSASNIQPWRFVVVRSREKRERIAGSGLFGRFVSRAPVVIVACGEEGSRYHVHDTCIALEHIVLAATGEGLGTCWVVSFDEGKVRELLKIPEGFKVVALLSVGYPAGGRDVLASILHLFRPRKELREIAFLEEFGKPFEGEAAPPGKAG